MQNTPIFHYPAQGPAYLAPVQQNIQPQQQTYPSFMPSIPSTEPTPFITPPPSQPQYYPTPFSPTYPTYPNFFSMPAFSLNSNFPPNLTQEETQALSNHQPVPVDELAGSHLETLLNLYQKPLNSSFQKQLYFHIKALLLPSNNQEETPLLLIPILQKLFDNTKIKEIRADIQKDLEQNLFNPTPTIHNSNSSSFEIIPQGIILFYHNFENFTPSQTFQNLLIQTMSKAFDQDYNFNLLQEAFTYANPIGILDDITKDFSKLYHENINNESISYYLKNLICIFTDLIDLDIQNNQSQLLNKLLSEAKNLYPDQPKEKDLLIRILYSSLNDIYQNQIPEDILQQFNHIQESTTINISSIPKESSSSQDDLESIASKKSLSTIKQPAFTPSLHPNIAHILMQQTPNTTPLFLNHNKNQNHTQPLSITTTAQTVYGKSQ